MIYTKNCFNSYFADLGMSEEGIWFGMLTCESCFLFELEPFIESVRPKEEKKEDSTLKDITINENILNELVNF